MQPGSQKSQRWNTNKARPFLRGLRNVLTWPDELYLHKNKVYLFLKEIKQKVLIILLCHKKRKTEDEDFTWCIHV